MAPSTGPRCPFCRSNKVELHSSFGSTLLVEQYYCLECRTVFEYLRDDEEPPVVEHPSTEPNDEDPAVIEGLTGRLPFLISSLLGIVGLGLMFNIRNIFHSNSDLLDFDSLSVWGPLVLLIVFLAAPLLHQAAHALALQVLRIPLRIKRRLIYPRIRPASALSRQQALWFLLAPLLLTAATLVLMPIRSSSALLALFNGVNIGLSAGDIWKALGLKRVAKTALIEVNDDHCRVVKFS